MTRWTDTDDGNGCVGAALAALVVAGFALAGICLALALRWGL